MNLDSLLASLDDEPPPPRFPRALAFPFIVVLLAAGVALGLGRLFAARLYGSMIDLSSLGWLIAAGFYALFVPFHFWMDALLIEDRRNKPFATLGAALRVSLKGIVMAVLAAFAAGVCGIGLLLALGEAHSPVAGLVMVAGIVALAGGTIAGAVVCIGRRRRLNTNLPPPTTT